MGRRYKLSDFLFLGALELFSPAKMLPVGSNPQSPIWTWDECHQLVHSPGPGDLLDASFPIYSNDYESTPVYFSLSPHPLSKLEENAPGTLAYQDSDSRLPSILADEVFAAESTPASNGLPGLPIHHFMSSSLAPGTSSPSHESWDFDSFNVPNTMKGLASSPSLVQLPKIGMPTEQAEVSDLMSPFHSYHGSRGFSAGWSTAPHNSRPEGSVMSQNSPTTTFDQVDQHSVHRTPALTSESEDSSLYGATTWNPASFTLGQRMRAGWRNMGGDEFPKRGRENLNPPESAQTFPPSTLHQQSKIRKLVPGEDSGTGTASQGFSSGMNSRVSQPKSKSRPTIVILDADSPSSTPPIPTELGDESPTESLISTEATSNTSYEAAGKNEDAEAIPRHVSLRFPAEIMRYVASTSPGVTLPQRQAESLRRFFRGRKPK